MKRNFAEDFSFLISLHFSSQKKIQPKFQEIKEGLVEFYWISDRRKVGGFWKLRSRAVAAIEEVQRKEADVYTVFFEESPIWFCFRRA
ncbi:hypothetical protein SLE2022_302740 [Rubroshorea leprosula]